MVVVVVVVVVEMVVMVLGMVLVVVVVVHHGDVTIVTHSYTEKYCQDKWEKCEYAHQVYTENVQIATSTLGYDAFGSNQASTSDTSSPLE